MRAEAAVPRGAGAAIVASILGLLLAVAGFPIAVPPQPDQGASDLKRLRDEITQMRALLESKKVLASTAEQELETLDLELSIRTRELGLAEEARRRVESEVRAVAAQIDGLVPSIERQKRFLAARLVALYRLGGLNYLRAVISVGESGNPVEAATMMSYLVGRDVRAVARFKQARVRLRSELKSLSEKRLTLARASQAVAARREALLRTYAVKERMVTSLRRESSDSALRLAELEEKARRLERLFELLYTKSSRSSAPAGNISEFEGVLDWPLRGKVVERFGKVRNPRFATVTVNNGIKIDAKAGADVRAVFQGTVLYSQWFKGYGNLVVVDHGSQIFSLYGNTRSPRVKSGDRVDAGQTVASVAERDDGESSYVYFEIRKSNKPSDPEKWLR